VARIQALTVGHFYEMGVIYDQVTVGQAQSRLPNYPPFVKCRAVG
jgi:hypothetical protein